MKSVQLPPESPDLNPFAERFVLSIKQECLNRIIPLGEWHLRRVVKEYVAHYHEERNHQGLDNELIEGKDLNLDPNCPVKKRSRLGGLLNFYYREAS